MAKKEIKCPIESCDLKFKTDSKVVKGDLQHHLFMAHKFNAIEAHAKANATIEALQ